MGFDYHWLYDSSIRWKRVIQEEHGTEETVVKEGEDAAYRGWKARTIKTIEDDRNWGDRNCLMICYYNSLGFLWKKESEGWMEALYNLNRNMSIVIF